MVELKLDSAQLGRLLQKLDRLNLQDLAGPLLAETGEAIQRKAGAYPAPVPGSVRTGHLGASWYQTVFPGYLEVGNLAVYAGWMHGSSYQRARAKRRGWKLLLPTARAELPELMRKLRARIQAVWEGR